MSTPFAGSTAITNQCPVRGRLCRGPRLAPPPPTMSNNAGGLLGVHAPFPACATGRDFGLPCGAAFAPPPPPPGQQRRWPPGRGYPAHTSARGRDFASRAGPRLVPP